MSQPNITAAFSDDLWTCDVTIEQGGKEYTYHNLRVRKVNLRDWQEPQMTYGVRIPCAAALGCDYYLCAGRDAVFGYIHPERKPLTLTIAGDDDEIIDIPQRKKGKKCEEWRQMQLFSAAGKGGGE